MLVPYQKFGSRGSFPAFARSQYLCAFFVRNMYVCCGALLQASKIRSIHSSGTHAPNRSLMLPTKMLDGALRCSGYVRV